MQSGPGGVPYGVQSASSGWNNSDNVQAASNMNPWYNVRVSLFFESHSLMLWQIQPHYAYNHSLPPESCPEWTEPGLSTDNLACIRSLAHGTLIATSNPVYLNCLDTLAKKDQEISLLKDHMFNLQ